jgi:hypothetical protein
LERRRTAHYVAHVADLTAVVIIAVALMLLT